MLVLYKNMISDATITPTTEAIGYEASVSLKDTRMARKWRTTSIASVQRLAITSPADGCTADYCVIDGHNITSDATVVLEGSDNGYSYTTIGTVSPVRITNYLEDEFGEPLADESGDLCITSDYPSLLWVSRDIRVLSFAMTCYKYYRISITDTLNPDGYIEVGKVFIGESLELPQMTPEIEIPTTTTADTSSSLSGQRYGDRRAQLKTASIKCPSISHDDRNDINIWFNTVDIIDPFWLVIWESDVWAEAPIYCALTKGLKWKKLATGEDWSLEFEFLECK